MGLFTRENNEIELPDMEDIDGIEWSNRDLKYEALSKRIFDYRYRKAIIRGRNRVRKQQIKDMKKSFSPKRFKYNSNIQTSKLIMGGIFLNCTIIEIYAMLTMYIMQDLTALDTLIGSILTEGISFAVYSFKAYAETRESERINLERDKLFRDEVGEDNESIEDDEEYIDEEDESDMTDIEEE